MAKAIFDAPLESFRVRPVKGTRYYFLVHLASDLKAMKAAMRKHTGSAHPQQLAACVAARGRGESNQGLVGLLFFATSHLGSGIVAHEMAHAAFRYCELKRLRVAHWDRPTHPERTNVVEESFCDYLEELTRQFWCRYYESNPG